MGELRVPQKGSCTIYINTRRKLVIQFMTSGYENGFHIPHHLWRDQMVDPLIKVQKCTALILFWYRSEKNVEWNIEWSAGEFGRHDAHLIPLLYRRGIAEKTQFLYHLEKRVFNDFGNIQAGYGPPSMVADFYMVFFIHIQQFYQSHTFYFVYIVYFYDTPMSFYQHM